MKFGTREAIFFVLLIAIPIGAWMLLFQPRSDRVAADLQQIEAKRAKLQALNRATATISDLKAEIGELDQAIAFFRSKLPQEKEIDQILKEVWKLAEQNQLATKSIRTTHRVGGGAAEQTGPYAEQPIDLELEGDFYGLYSFLLALENKPRITRLQQMELDKAANAPEGQMRAKITLSVFFERDGRKEL